MSSKQAVPALAATARPGPQRRPNSASPAVERSRDEHALAHRPAPRRFGPCSRGERRAMAPSTVPGPSDTLANLSQDLDRRAARRRRDGYGDLGRRGDPRGVRCSAGPTARCSPPRGRRTARDGAVRSQPRRTRATARWSCSSPPAPGGPAEGESQPGDPGCPGRGAAVDLSEERSAPSPRNRLVEAGDARLRCAFGGSFRTLRWVATSASSTVGRAEMAEGTVAVARSPAQGE